MKLTEKINFRQPKYMLPAILYIPILFLGFFVIRLFGTEKAEVDKSNLETTEFFNDKLPDANIKGDGIGDKYTNMLNDFGKIKDESAVENIERGGEDIKEEYTSQYSDAEVAAMDPNSKQAQESLERKKPRWTNRTWKPPSSSTTSCLMPISKVMVSATSTPICSMTLARLRMNQP